MKILIVNKFLYPNGGSETYIFKLGEELLRQGHEVQYFGMEHEGRIVGNHTEIYTSNMDFHTSKLSRLLYPFKIIYSKEAYKKIKLVLDDFKPDVVHLNNFNFQLTPSIIYAIRDWERKNKKRVKIIYTAHDYQWVCPNHMLQIPATKELCFRCEGGKFGECAKNKCIHNSKLKSLLGTLEANIYKKKKTYSLIDIIICPSYFLKEKLDSYEGFSEKTVVMHNFIDRISYDVNCMKENYVLYYGRYVAEKGVGTLISVCKKHPEISFKFAGSGPLEYVINSISNIENLGFLDGQDMIDTITRAKLVIVPSEWYENCPFTVMETQMFGTPLLASNIGGIPELMNDEITGELFEAGNAQDMEYKLLDILNPNNEKLEKYTRNCRNSNFDGSEKYVHKYIKLINEFRY